MVRVLEIYSDDLSSDPVDGLHFLYRFLKKQENKQK